MGSSDLTAIRHFDDVDLYINSNGRLLHYWASPKTDWNYNCEQIYDQIATKCAVIRNGPDMDVYCVTTGSQLLHLWVGDGTNWQYNSGTMYGGLAHVPPAAVRFENNIDVFCVDSSNQIVHLRASDQTNWNYESEIIYSAESQIGGLAALRTCRQALDVYFVNQGKIVNISAGDHNSWRFQPKPIQNRAGISPYCLVPTRWDNNIDIFFIDTEGFICKYSIGERTQWQPIDGGRIANGTCKTRDFKLSAVRFGEHIDVYFVGDNNRVWHTYSGAASQWAWNSPEQISEMNAITGIAAVRPMEKAIDVFFLSENDEMRNLFIGEGTGGDWGRYGGGFLNKSILRFEEIENICVKIGEGYNGFAYICKPKSIVIKILKRPNMQTIKNEVEILDRLHPIWPNICQYQVTRGGQLVGFTQKFFPGVKLDHILHNQNNVYNTNPQSRIRFVKRLRGLIRKIQQLGVCHGDLTLDNLLVHQPHESKQDCDIFIIDFGNGFIFDHSTTTNSVLTGWQFAKPPESRHGGAYNPSGVNSYMFGRLALQILLKTPYKDYRTKIRKDPGEEFNRLLAKGFDQSVVRWISQLLSENPHKRNEALNGPSNMQEKVRKVDKKKEPSDQPKSKPEKTPEQKLYDGLDDEENVKKMLDDDELAQLKKILTSQQKYQWTWTTEKKINETTSLFYATAGVELEKNIFFTVSAKASASFMKIVQKSDHPIKQVSVELFKVGVQAKLGAYTGIEIYAALVDCQISIFDLRLGVGVSTGVGFMNDSFQFKAFGCGFSVGRRMGISIFGSEFAIDFKRIFTQKQWDSLCQIAKLYFVVPFTAFKIARDFTRDGRQIKISMVNLTKYKWKHELTYFQHGDYFSGESVDSEVGIGKSATAKVCKQVGFYGVMGIIAYNIHKIDYYAIFYFYNPYNGANRVYCELFHTHKWNAMSRKEIYGYMDYKRLHSNQWYQDNDENRIVKLYYLKGGNSSIAAFYLINQQLLEGAVDVQKLKQVAEGQSD